MNPLSRVIDFFWWNHGDRDEERQWQSSGSFPDVVERAYRKQRDFQRDADRLKAMGYKVVSVVDGHATTMARASAGAAGRITTPDITEFIQVRYEREGDTLLAPGAEIDGGQAL